MKRSLFVGLILTVVLAFSGNKSLAQTQYTGCLYNNILYYVPNGTSGGFPNYNTNPNINLSSAFCVESIGGTCRVNKKKNQQGTLYTFYLVECPIDDYVLLMICTIGGLGFFMIRRGNMIKTFI